MIPDGEKLVSGYLRTHPAVVALDTRIVATTPDEDKRDTTWVKLTQLDATNEARSRPEHLISFLLQLDCYAGKDGGQPEAVLLARTVRAALVAMPEVSHDGAAVTQARVLSHARIPDTAFEKARERVILTVDVKLHA